ncbi:cyclase/dehydrase START-like domain-containing protein [Rhizobium etli 8C-3]|uniref:Cyclase/dehydrase START-like domain-containing protein n=1 Tax=Rhizobium etli 8C-3 TaxID=538025 RepID=A0A1L5P683_RHIET|nr:AtaL-like protein [Rhizobium etli]APO75679.1 cyclase/dehydrase START-like domain-containing protein [Rhizobium etli 8C-3]
MIYSTATVPVNPAGEAPLTRAQAWKGLELKARDARSFLAPGLCTRCEVIEESTAHFLREATIGGNDLREIVTLEHESRITFFQAAGPREGAIINELYEDEDGAPQLRFYCYMGLRAKQPNGREEQTEQAQLASEHGYKAALLSTLKRTRELLAEGTLYRNTSNRAAS